MVPALLLTDHTGFEAPAVSNLDNLSLQPYHHRKKQFYTPAYAIYLSMVSLAILHFRALV
jgi:hypothetical protein